MKKNMTEKNKFISHYAGVELLETLQEAKRYNTYLKNEISKYGKGATAIMDFGAGIGTFSDVHDIKNVIAVELDPELCNYLKEQGYRSYSSLSDIKDTSIDFIYTLNVLEHIEDDESILKELHSKLKPGGKIFIYVPAFNVLFSSMDRKVKHFRRYKKSDTINLMKQLGYEVEQAEYVDSMGFFVTLLYKRLNRSGEVNKTSVKIYDTIVFPISRIFDKLGLSKLFGKNLQLVASRKLG